jgi:hypothetical protein
LLASARTTTHVFATDETHREDGAGVRAFGVAGDGVLVGGGDTATTRGALCGAPCDATGALGAIGAGGLTFSVSLAATLAIVAGVATVSTGRASESTFRDAVARVLGACFGRLSRVSHPTPSSTTHAATPTPFQT